MLKKLLAIILLIWSIIVLGYLSINQDAIRYAGEQKAIERAERARVTTRFLSGFYDSLGVFSEVFLTVILPIAIVGVVGVVVVGIAVRINEKRWANRHHAHDGIFPLIDHRLRLPDGSRATLTTNPNLLPAPQTLTVHNGALAYGYQLPSSLSEDAQLRAMQIGRQANNLQAMPAQRMGGLQRSMEGGIVRPPRVIGGGESAAALPMANVVPMSIGQAFEQSTPERWIVGRSNTGALATFEPERDVHFAIIGATGTGKSAGIGMMALTHALRNGWQVVVLDGKGGADWSMFAPWVEYHRADETTLPDQVAALVAEFDRRRHGESQCIPSLWIVEEYTQMNDDMHPADRDRANAGLARLANQARDLNIHLCIIGQEPGRWDANVLQNTKAKYVFQLERGEAIKAYKAHELDVVGEFIFRGNRYRSFDMKPHVERIKTFASQAPRYPMLIDGECERLEYEPLPNVDVFRKTSGGKWDELIERYVAEHPEALDDNPPRGTIADLARRMAAADGNLKPYENYKGEASEGLKGYRGAE